MVVILVSAGAGAVASVVVAYVTARMTARGQIRQWRTEIAEKYADLVTDQPLRAQALARQFAIGVFIVESPDMPQREKIFILPQTRMIAGRLDSNEVVLSGPYVSRRQFAISADSSTVYVEDLQTITGMHVNGVPVEGRTALHNGDVIGIGPSGNVIEFRRAPHRPAGQPVPWHAPSTGDGALRRANCPYPMV
jgi:hypothetical protein